MVYTVNMVYTFVMVYTVNMVCNIYTIHAVDTVDTVYTIQTALHCLNSSMFACILLKG